jgi:hypothetical protein
MARKRCKCGRDLPTTKQVADGLEKARADAMNSHTDDADFRLRYGFAEMQIRILFSIGYLRGVCFLCQSDAYQAEARAALGLDKERDREATHRQHGRQIVRP